mmetsp:Transcript_20031/g.55129  ORF Transcript_20031/g.55129 Transcript_20031/m.55129 type:complete len:218 (+) Transcript_20031:307-960(+)
MLAVQVVQGGPDVHIAAVLVAAARGVQDLAIPHQQRRGVLELPRGQLLQHPAVPQLLVLGLHDPLAQRLLSLLRTLRPELLGVGLLARLLQVLQAVLHLLLGLPLHLEGFARVHHAQDLLAAVDHVRVLAPGAPGRLEHAGVGGLRRYSVVLGHEPGEAQMPHVLLEPVLVAQAGDDLRLAGQELPAGVPQLRLVVSHVLRGLVLRWQQPAGVLRLW